MAVTMLNRTPSQTLPWRILVLAALAGAIGCGDPPTQPGVDSVSLAKGGNGGGGGPKVRQTDPDSAPQDITLDVRVLGSGFEPGAVATFLLDGVATGGVRTNSTGFVSAKELVANITISEDAIIDLYDVEVFLAGPGRRGIGADLFAVVEKGPAQDPPITVTFEDRAGDNIRSDGRVIGDDGRVIYVHEECGVFATLNIRDARMVTDNQKIRPKDATVCGGRDPRLVEVEFSSDDLVAGSPRRVELEGTVWEGHFFKVNEIELMITGTDELVSAVVHLPACGHGLRFSSNRTDQDGLGIAVNDVLVTRNTDGTWTARAEPPNDVAVCIPDEHDKDPPPRTYWHMPFQVTVALKP